MISSRNLLNLLLLILVIGLAWWVYISSRESEAPEAATITMLGPADITQLRLQHGNTKLLFEREDETWWLRQPKELIANEVLMRNLLSWFGQPSEQHYPLVGLEVAEYGLAPPQARLQADDVELVFGGLNPLNSRRYVLAGDQLHMVTRNDISSLLKEWQEYVAPSLIPGDNKIARLSIEGFGVLKRDAEGWRYEGDHPPVSADQLQAFVDRWQYAQALDVDAAVEAEGRAVEIEFINGQTWSLQWVMRDGEWWLQRPELEIAYRFADGGMLLDWPVVDGVQESL